MNIFAWLFVGHMVGDWLLQNDWMARGKKTGMFALPGLVHYSIYTAVTVSLPPISRTRKVDWLPVDTEPVLVF